jgi:hypothetical protein
MSDEIATPKKSIEIRFREADPKALEEIVVWDESGKCIFHLEQMGDAHWWFSITAGQKTVDVDFVSDAKISVSYRQEDD